MDATTLAAAVLDATTTPQRWKDKRVRYKPNREVFDTRRAELVVMDGDDEARRFIERHHYSGSYPAAKFRVGLMVKPRLGREYLGGVVVFGVPITQKVVPAALPGVAADEGVEVSRVLLLDTPEVSPQNAESFLGAGAIRLLVQRFPELRGLVSFCDPVERRDARGQLVKRSHTGTIYRAMGFAFSGTSSPRTLLLTPDGQVLSGRALTKLTRGERGAAYVEAGLRERGAAPRAMHEEPRAWIERLRTDGFLRPLRHPGNLRFTLRLDARPSLVKLARAARAAGTVQRELLLQAA